MRGLFLLLALLLPVAVFAQEKRTHINVTAGDVTLDYHLHGGLQASLDDINIIRGSSLWVVAPGWTEHIYGLEKFSNTTHDAVIEKRPDGTTVITFDMRPDGDVEAAPFTGEHVIALTPDHKLTFDARFKLNADRRASIEWKVAALNPVLLAVSEFTVETWDGATSRGIIPFESNGASVEESTVARHIKRLTIESRIGPIVIEANEAIQLILFDYRKNKWADESRPMFWLGQLDRALTTGKEEHYEVSIQLPATPKPLATFAGAKVGTVDAIEMADALVPRPSDGIIIPTPKKIEYTTARMRLDNNTVIVAGEEADAAVKFLLRDLKDFYGIQPQRGSAHESGTAIIFEVDSASNDSPESEEGYLLRANENETHIVARTSRGLFNGATTLVQLIDVDGSGVAVRGVEITDWPSLKFRGVHALSGKNAGDEIADAVRNLLARYKMNSFVWECEYIVWDAAPELEHPQYGMTKSDAGKVVRAAEENLIELIPLVQSLGHSEWIFVNGNNLDIAEDPEMPYAYMPTNPRTYEFIFSVYQEALDFFKPSKFHIGHDEVTMRGRFPHRSKDSGKGVTELVAEDIDKLNAWFDERGVEVMMWGDMALAAGEAPDATFAPNSEEAQKRRDLLPRDVIITDWHYAPAKPEEYTSLGIWKKEGLRVIGAPWYNPNNIYNLSRACIENDAEGLLQTTWAGFNFRIRGNEPAWHQYWAYILAAHYSWSGDTTPPEQLPFRARDLFLDSIFREKPLLKPAPGYTVDLRPFMNRTLADQGNPDGFLGMGEHLDFRNLPTGKVTLNGTRFNITTNDAGQAAVVLAGRFHPKGEFPESVRINFTEPQPTSELHFLMAAAFPGRDKTKAGELVVHFEDRSGSVIELVYGGNLFHPTENRASRESRIAWEGTTAHGKPLRLWDFEWDYSGKKKVTGIEIRSEGNESAPVILAVTGVH